VKHILLILLVISTALTLGAEQFIIRFAKPSQQLIKEISSKNLEITAYKPEYFLDLLVTEEEARLLTEEGFSYSITQTEEQLKNNLNERDLEGYRNYEQLYNDLNLYTTISADICQLSDIGDSWGKIYSETGIAFYDDYNHDIWALKLSDNVNEEEDEPNIYFLATHHAREPISLEVCMNLLEYLLSNYGTNEQITDLVNNSQIWFVPLINPDGHKVVTTENDVWWRKNIRDNNLNNIFNNSVDGVDPNRNYGFQWGFVGASGDFEEENYHGPEPWSEPEVQAIKNLMDSRHFLAGISYHSYSELILLPYGYAADMYAPDYEALFDLAVNMAETIPSQQTGHYTPQTAWELYPCMGTSDDYSYGEHGTFAYTVELATEFIPPASQVEEICEDNLEAALLILDRVNHATLTGIITDSSTGNPIEAEIFIETIDDSPVYRAPYRSDETFGRYYRLLLPGNYNVTFSAYGYIPESFSAIAVNNDSQTILNVSLEQATLVDFSGTVLNSFTDEPISEARVTLSDCPLDPVNTNESGNFYFENIAEGLYNLSVSAEGYSLFQGEFTITPNDNNVVIELYPAIFYDGFEDGTISWIINSAWDTTIAQSYTGNQCLTDSPEGQYGNNSDITCQINQSFLLDENREYYISFFMKHALEIDYDYLYLEISTDGEIWQPIDTYTGNNVYWQQFSYSLASFSGQEIQIRFRLFSDTYVTDDGVYIDQFTFYSPTSVTAADNNQAVTSGIWLKSYPNPFNINIAGKREAKTNISFNVIHPAENTTIEIYNIKGQQVISLINSKLEKGTHNITWNGKDRNQHNCSAGIYFTRFTNGSEQKTSKMLIVK